MDAGHHCLHPAGAAPAGTTCDGHADAHRRRDDPGPVRGDGGVQLVPHLPRSAAVLAGAGLAFLIGPGSILALSAYNVAVRRLSTSTVATYPYVNPVVAVILGATLLNERLTPAMLIGGALIIVAVALVVWRRGSPGH